MRSVRRGDATRGVMRLRPIDAWPIPPRRSSGLVAFFLRALTLVSILVLGSGLKLLLRLKSRRVDRVQEKVLNGILRANAATQLAKTLGLQRCTLEAYRRSKPITDYEFFRPFVEESLRTGVNLISADAIAGFTTTSGTSSAPKRILLTRRSFRRERRKEIILALFAIFRVRPLLIFRPALLMIAGQEAGALGKTRHRAAANALFRDSFFGRFSAVPSGVYDLADYEAKYYYYALLALASGCRMIITPNPSTIIKLVETREKHAVWLEEDLVAATLANRFDIPDEVLRTVAQRLASRPRGPVIGSAFPELRAVVCWQSGTSGFFWRRLKAMLPQSTAYFDLGYMASDSSLAYAIGSGGQQICAFDEVFFEFVPLDDSGGRPLLYGQLETGQLYQIVLTNAHGLYRYDIGDVIRVTGRFGGAPTIEFVRKVEGFSNLTGEKLSEEQILQAVKEADSRLALGMAYFAVAPELESSTYVLYAEIPQSQPQGIEHLATEVDEALKRANQEYRSKRDSGRLEGVVVRTVAGGTFEQCKQTLVASGRREAQFKLPHLIVDDGVRALLQALVVA